MSDYPPLPKVTDRTNGQKYMYKNEIVIWNGKIRLCEHKRERSKCKECGGGQICEHKRIRSQCKECGGGGICEHKKRRTNCKECEGGSICEHKRIRSHC